ncbi:MAG: ATP-binding cassette domain-containing protein, partial [Peptostreptococcaceae bacterium]|nr:ATP-binding cassette domain-containing protein [Peptostreptococcaceae bacterium]
MGTVETNAIKIENFSFAYPLREKACLVNLNLQVEYGEFIVLCGKSGSGKSTLLRQLKPSLSPHGEKSGEIYFYDRHISEVDFREESERIGYVLQNPDNQLVTDKVWHELAFGLESLGYDSKTIRLRVAEMASFFGIQTWYMKDVTELSGGQKQLLNLAAVMVMQPDVLILDEPTSQLDPIAASDFLETVKKINREIGTTVIISEHRLEEVLPMADKVIVLDEGQIIAEDIPENVGAILARLKHPMFLSMPTPMKVYSELYLQGIGKEYLCPVTVREGRQYLTSLMKPVKTKPIIGSLEWASNSDQKSGVGTKPANPDAKEFAVKLSENWFKYSKDAEDVIKDLSFEVKKGETFCIVGGNGTGKTTALNLIAGIKKPYRGKIIVNGSSCVLPQNPQALFVEMTVHDDLLEIFSENKTLSKEEKNSKVIEISKVVDIENLLGSHPYDLSGGEQQRAALAKVLLLDPEILLLDEPTKGIDNFFKETLGEILGKLKENGTTIIMVSHDIEFCCKFADTCAMFFDGSII